MTADTGAADEEPTKVWVSVEWFYKEVKLFRTTIDFKRKMRVGDAAVSSFYVGVMLLHNMRRCLYSNHVPQYFDCYEPSMEEYLTNKDFTPQQRSLHRLWTESWDREGG